AKGDKGDPGAPGAPGPKGDKGDPGAGLATGSISGQALNCGAALPGALVYVPSLSFSAITGPSGGFVLTYLPPGTYDIALEPMVGPTVTRSGIQVFAGLTTSVGGIDSDQCHACPSDYRF